MDVLGGGPAIWAQQATGGPGLNPPMLALRRWLLSLTLSSPEAMPSFNPAWAWLLGLAGLLLVTLVAQGPGRALRQLIDLPGHLRLLGAALARVRRAARLAAILIGAAVLTTTLLQGASYRRPEQQADLIILLKTKTLGQVAFEQGALAAVTPQRDVFGLGDNLVLLLVAAALVFKVSAERWGLGDEFQPAPRPPLPGWTTPAWGGAGLYLGYRLAGLFAEPDRIPLLGGCLFVEAGVVPLLMLAADGLLLGWALAELARGSEAGDEFAVRGAIELLPRAALACLLALPGRYAATAAWLLGPHLPDATSLTVRRAMSGLLLGWGLTGLQAAALLAIGLAGPLPWTRSGAFRGYGRLLRADGGYLVGFVALLGLAAGGLSAAAYAAVLSLPAQPWVLGTADGYAHYATLVVGLVLLGGLVDLGHRSRPEPEPEHAGDFDVVPEGGSIDSGAGARFP